MTHRLPLAASLLLAFAAPAVAQTAEETLQPFAALRAGYAAHDSAVAARAYTDDAVVIYAYDELPHEEHVGADAIRASFERALAQVRPEWTVDVNFKLDAATSATAADYDAVAGEALFAG
jgi:ketosteroid isomerase-like protein